MKRILPLILVALMIISLSSCSNPKFEHPISVSKLTDGDLKSVMLDYENDLMLELLNKGKWVDDIPNCGYDYEFEFGAHNVLRYHSECGTFIDTENSRSLTVSEQDKNKINESLNRSIKLPLGNEELLNLFSAALNEKGLRFGMFESEMLDFVDNLTFDDKEAEMAMLLSARNKIDNRRRRATTEAEKDECSLKRKAISKELKALRHDINLAKGVFPMIDNLKEKLRIEMEQEQEMFPRETGAKPQPKIKRNEDRNR